MSSPSQDPDALLAAVKAGSGRKRGRPSCAVCDLLATTSPAFADRVRELLDDDDIATCDIVGPLQAQGWEIADYTINRHRRAQCSGERARTRS